MPGIEKVLIATDGSDHARKAVSLGADIASKHDAKVILVHVLLRRELSENLRHMAEIEHLSAEGGRSLSEEIADLPAGRFPADMLLTGENAATPNRVLQAVAEQVLGQAEKLARAQGARSVETRIEDGNPVDRILHLVEAEGVDLLVTGARGLSDLKSLMVGSVSHKLSHLSPVTCVTVR